MERGQENLLDQIGSQLAPAAVPEHDLRMRKNRQRARPKDRRNRLSFTGFFHFRSWDLRARHSLGCHSVRSKRRDLGNDFVQLGLEMPPVRVVRSASAL